MRRFNLHTAELTQDGDEPAGYDAGYARFGRALGAEQAGATLYELVPGQSNCPYHYEVGDEEWLIVLAGRLAVRHPDGEDVLEPGDVVCFPPGPAGAHKLTNKGEEPVRVLMFSVNHFPAVAVYPDSDKVGTFTHDETANVMVRRDASVDYWEGER
jgi:uncharacterized cupin superfamily protein